MRTALAILLLFFALHTQPVYSQLGMGGMGGMMSGMGNMMGGMGGMGGGMGF